MFLVGATLPSTATTLPRPLQPPGLKLDEIIRFRKLHLDTSFSSIVEEAAQLLARERQIEAEALIENVKARIRCA